MKKVTVSKKNMEIEIIGGVRLGEHVEVIATFPQFERADRLPKKATQFFTKVGGKTFPGKLDNPDTLREIESYLGGRLKIFRVKLPSKEKIDIVGCVVLSVSKNDFHLEMDYSKKECEERLVEVFGEKVKVEYFLLS